MPVEPRHGSASYTHQRVHDTKEYPLRGYYVDGQYFYNDGKYPGKLLLVDDGTDIIWGPPELKGLHYPLTTERREQFLEEVNAFKNKN